MFYPDLYRFTPLKYQNDAKKERNKRGVGNYLIHHTAFSNNHLSRMFLLHVSTSAREVYTKA
jgi:hypothetical protein